MPIDTNSATDARWQRFVRPPGLEAGSWHLRCGTLASLLGIRGGLTELKGQPPRSSGALKKNKAGSLTLAMGWPLASAVRDTGFTVGNTRQPCRIERPATAIICTLKKTKLARLRSLWAGRWPAVTSTREGGNAADRERIETHLDGWGLQGFSATTHEAARPEGRVLASAVRDTGFTVGNTRRPCRIERPATAIIGTLKKNKAGSLTLAMGWPLASRHFH